MAEQSWTPAEWCARAAAEPRARLEPRQPFRTPARRSRNALAGRWRRARARGPPASGRCCARPASWSSWWSTSAASRAPRRATSSCTCRRGAPPPPCATSLPAHLGLLEVRYGVVFGRRVALHTPTFPAVPVEHTFGLAHASTRYQLLSLRARCALAALAFCFGCSLGSDGLGFLGNFSPPRAPSQRLGGAAHAQPPGTLKKHISTMAASCAPPQACTGLILSHGQVTGFCQQLSMHAHACEQPFPSLCQAQLSLPDTVLLAQPVCVGRGASAWPASVQQKRPPQQLSFSAFVDMWLTSA